MAEERLELVGSLIRERVEEKNEHPDEDRETNLMQRIARLEATIDELRQSERSLRESEKRFRSLVEHNFSDIVTIIEADGTVRSYQSPAIERVLGQLPGRQVGTNVFERIHPDDIERALSLFVEVLDKPGLHPPIEFRVPHTDGSWRYLEHIVNNQLDDPAVKGIVVSSRDITERKVLEEQLRHQAFHDSLTGLPNRVLFMDRLEQALVRRSRRQGSIAILFLDLDNFKLINDSLGHEMGNRLLKAVSERLEGCLRTEDTVARLGGDEFAVLLEDVHDEGEATEVAERIEEELQKPVAFGEREAFVSASIGIVLTSTAWNRPEDLLQSADTAMYQAKDKGKAQCQVFDPGMDTHALERLELRSDLRRAVEREEFVVFYQPKVLMETGDIVGMEALIYWDHPERGLVPPSEFVSIAEGSRLILPIGRRLLQEACQQGREFQDVYDGDVPLMMSVSLSARQLRQPDLVECIAGLLKETDLIPHSLNLNVAEDVAMKDARSTIAKLRELKSLGTQMTINNFGTGYSSLGYLNRFPLSFLEIERSFIGRLWEGATEVAVVSGIISLAHALGLTATAEGVETFEQVVQLRRLGCDLARGNYFSEPLPGEEAAVLLASGHRYAGWVKPNH
ncbi:MAG: EAL domain-containing protein [Rubrobacter sp.]|nr:EAL domain-containing protein [Rubrobacter sp.]